VFPHHVKRIVLTLAAAAVLALLAVAAPALSLRPYAPEPRDYDLAAPARIAQATGGRGVTGTLRAPGRFNLVGVRWQGGALPTVWLRARLAGHAWSRWAEVPAETSDAPDPHSREHSRGTGSSPVWVGEADYVQYHLTRRVPGLRAHFVNTTGTATRADRLTNAVRRLANRGLLAVAGTPIAQAASSRPHIAGRRSWGASRCPPRQSPEYASVKAAFVHHTVGTNNYTRGDVPSIILGICRYHRNGNGWNDIGYNFLVDKWGRIWEGRAGGVTRAVQGAQAQGYNAQSTGVANLGTFSSRRQSGAAIRALARLLKWKLGVHHVPTRGKAGSRTASPRADG
jgi:N-acetylmuramoyl-L-alanine amidase-like protein